MISCKDATQLWRFQKCTSSNESDLALNLIFFPSRVAQTCDSFKPLTILHSFVGTNVRVRLLLYTRIDSDCGVLLSHTNLSAHPQFNFSRPTTFVIHGFRPTGSAPAWLNKIRELLLARSNINLVIVDWNHGAATINYWTAVENTHKVAENLTAFINLTLVWKTLISIKIAPLYLWWQVRKRIVDNTSFCFSGPWCQFKFHPFDRCQSWSSYIRFCWC